MYFPCGRRGVPKCLGPGFRVMRLLTKRIGRSALCDETARRLGPTAAESTGAQSTAEEQREESREQGAGSREQSAEHIRSNPTPPRPVPSLPVPIPSLPVPSCPHHHPPSPSRPIAPRIVILGRPGTLWRPQPGLRDGEDPGRPGGAGI